MSVQEKKQKSIAEAIKVIHKQFGSGSLMRLDGSQTTQTVTDASGNGRHGTIRGTLKQVSGPDAQS